MSATVTRAFVFELGRDEAIDVRGRRCGVSTQGDFEPLVDEATFYRAQAVLDGRVVVAGPRQRNHPDFPPRGFVRCEICGRPLTGSWSKGRNGHYAYYHCQRQCRAVNVSKAAPKARSWTSSPSCADTRLHAPRQGSNPPCVGAA